MSCNDNRLLLDNQITHKGEQEWKAFKNAWPSCSPEAELETRGEHKVQIRLKVQPLSNLFVCWTRRVLGSADQTEEQGVTGERGKKKKMGRRGERKRERKKERGRERTMTMTENENKPQLHKSPK